MKIYSRNGDYYGTYDNNNFIPAGKDVTVTKVEKQLENNDIYITLEFYIGAEKQTIRCKGNDLQHKLNSAGYLVSNTQMSTLNDYIRQQCENINTNYIHCNIGWDKFEDKIIFKGDGSLGIKSDYIGNADIKPKGKLSDYVADYEKIIYGNIPLETSIIIGLSGSVVGYLSLMSDVCPPSVIFDINGRFTTGKTTCARLAVSQGGGLKSELEKTSLSSTCSTTLNALYGQLANNFGYTMLLDETARLGNSFDYTGMIYAIADGIDKSRMQRNGKIRPPKHWATSIIFSGEFPLLSKTKKADGLSVRVIPFNNVKWTTDQNQAHQVEEFSTSYAGLSVWELAKHIIPMNTKDVVDLYKAEITQLTNHIPTDPCYQERIAKSVAVLTVTAKLAAEALNIKFHWKEILDFVLDKIQNGACENEAENAFNFIINKYYENSSKFLYPPSNNDNSTYTTAKKDCWGNIRRDYFRNNGKSKLNSDLLIIVKDKFLQWMEEGGFTNVENILREWRHLGVILTQKSDHFYSYIVLQKNDPQTKCIRIVLNNNVYSVDTPDKADEKFSDIFYRRVFDSEYKKYASGDCVYDGMLRAVRKSIEKLSEENLESGLAEEIIKNCIKVSIDFPRIQSFLYGQDHDDWCKKKKEGKNDAVHDDDQDRQEKLE